MAFFSYCGQCRRTFASRRFLMILRRVIAHVRKQEWTAIALDVPGDYTGFENVIDYPCESGPPEAELSAAGDALRANPETLRYLRQRFADLETRLADLTGNNRDVLEGYLEIVKEKP